MKNSRFIYSAVAVLVVGILLICTACKEEPYDAKTYYDVIGEGYVFMRDSTDNILYPVKGAIMTVSTISGGEWIGSRTDEFFTTDETGKYRVRFIKRTKRSDADLYIIRLSNYMGSADGSCEFSFSVDEIKNAKQTILLDPIKTCNGYFY